MTSGGEGKKCRVVVVATQKHDSMTTAFSSLLRERATSAHISRHCARLLILHCMQDGESLTSWQHEAVRSGFA